MNGKGIGPHNAVMLDMFGELVRQAWGETAYRVGSSIAGDSWRDIDIRVMLPDAHFYRFFLDRDADGELRSWRPRERHGEPMWKAHMLAWSKLGEALTGLPIDFQVETIDEANREFPDEPRIPLIGFRR